MGRAVAIACVFLLGGCDRLFGLLDVDAVEPDTIGPDAAADPTSPDAGSAFGCPAEFSLLLPGSDSRYLIGTSATWLDAANACSTYRVVGGTTPHLVVLSNDAERSALAEVLGESDVWIGYTDRASDNVFRWVTSEAAMSPPLHESPWENDDPDYEGDGCVNLRTSSLIGDKGCDNVFPHVCECDLYNNEPSRY